MIPRGLLKIQHRPRQTRAGWLPNLCRRPFSQAAHSGRRPIPDTKSENPRLFLVAGNGLPASKTSDPSLTQRNPAWPEFARTYGIEASHVTRSVRDIRAPRQYGFRIFFDQERHINRYHDSYLLSLQALNAKYMSMYRTIAKHPLFCWVCDAYSAPVAAVVRSAASRIAKRALHQALKANGYNEYGVALEDDDRVRGTELYGTIQLTILNPKTVAKTKFEPRFRKEFVDTMTKQLRESVIPELRRPVEALPGTDNPPKRKDKTDFRLRYYLSGNDREQGTNGSPSCR